jgi:hypothetical protein
MKFNESSIDLMHDLMIWSAPIRQFVLGLTLLFLILFVTSCEKQNVRPDLPPEPPPQVPDNLSAETKGPSENLSQLQTNKSLVKYAVDAAAALFSCNVDKVLIERYVEDGWRPTPEESTWLDRVLFKDKR